jgi:hypothetical protein
MAGRQDQLIQALSHVHRELGIGIDHRQQRRDPE